MSRRTIILTLVVLIIAAISSWFTWHAIESGTNSHINKPKNPDAIGYNVTYMQMDAEGKLKHKVYSPKLIHFPYKDSSTFITPRIVVMNDPANPWVITADKGSSTQGITTIYLIGNVKVHQAPGPHNTELTITTSKATIKGHQKFVETDQPVTIIKPGTVITAVGANANLKTKVINLLSNVKEKYVPQQK